MSLLSFVKFPYRMPDGYVEAEDYSTKDLLPLEFKMRCCAVTANGRLVCDDDGDLHYEGSMAIEGSTADRPVYLLYFEAGTLKELGCFESDGSVRKVGFDASNYHSIGA